MSKFEIFKDVDELELPWFLQYPPGFTETPPWGVGCATFADAIEAFVKASEAQCPMCLRGAVGDTDWGWECANCGANDVAVGCVKS